MRALRINCKFNDVPALACVLAISAIVFMSGAFQAGFLSDDFDLLVKAGAASLWAPLERHHFSPLLTFLFKLGAAGFLQAWMWHLIAWLTHAVNTMLVHRLVRHGFRQSAPMALCLALLFALNPAGYEALAWASAIGYALVAMPILIALNLVLGQTCNRRAAWGLAGLQLAGYLIWDWGVLLTPLVLIAAFMKPLPGRKPAWAAMGGLLWPVIIVWMSGLMTKVLLLQGMGYHTQPFRMIIALEYLAASPLIALVPNLTIHAYQSIYGIFAAAGLLLVLGWVVIRMPEARLPAVLFLVCQFPYVFFSAPQSRYFYLPVAFIYCMVLMAAFRLPRVQWTALLSAMLVTISLWWAIERSFLWRSAWQQAQMLRERILALPETGSELVIVNLPDCHGPDGMIWRPYVWRNGMPGFGRSFVRVYTPGCPFTWEHGPVLVLPRELIRPKYPTAMIYEVVQLQNQCQITYTVTNFNESFSKY